MANTNWPASFEVSVCIVSIDLPKNLRVDREIESLIDASRHYSDLRTIIQKSIDSDTVINCDLAVPEGNALYDLSSELMTSATG